MTVGDDISWQAGRTVKRGVIVDFRHSKGRGGGERIIVEVKGQSHLSFVRPENVI